MSLPRPSRLVAAAALLALALVAPALPGAAPARAAGPAGPEPVFTALDSVVTAGDNLHWEVRFTLHNTLPTGLYPDSLWCETEDLDPGQTRAPRKAFLDIQRLLVLVANVGANEETAFQLEGPAAFEHGWLDFHLLLHDMEKRPYALHTRVELRPGPASERYPSRFLTVDGRKVETVLVPAVREGKTGPAPGVLLLHDDGENARKLLRSALYLSGRGYTVMLVSMPGYGLSEGEPDFMGPASVSAAQAALDELARTPEVDPQRLGAWGEGRGANLAMTLALRRPDLAAVVAESGIYDLWAAARADAAIRKAIVAEAGGDSSAWRERSPALNKADGLKAAVLFVHGEQDARAPVAQARAFYEALGAAGKNVQAKFLPGGAQALPRNPVLMAAQAFLAKALRP